MPSPSPRGNNYEIAKIHWRNLQIFFSRHWAISNQTWQKASLLKGDSSLFKYRAICPFPRGDNYEKAKIHWWNLKIFFSRTTGPSSTKHCTKHPLMKETQGFTNKDHSLIKKEMIFFSSSPSQCYDMIIALSKYFYWFKLVSQVSDVAYVPLV